jgi:ATP-binding cassette subfamily F protein 3
LQEVLDQYQGTILLVSHDRYLIDALGSQIWEILPGQAMLQVFAGTYTEYKEYQAQCAEQSEKIDLTHAVAPRKSRPARLSPEEKKRRSRLKEVEERIAYLENELGSLSRKLETPPADLAKVQKLGRAYAGFQDELDRLMAEWEGLHGETAPA